MGELQNRYEFTILLDVKNGNPNGDPDEGNRPRTNSQGYGIMSPACIKSKIRNAITELKGMSEGYRMYIAPGDTLNERDEEAYSYLDLDRKKLPKDDPELADKILNFMCKNFADIRMFGAVMTTFKADRIASSNITGPVQLGFAESIDPVQINTYSLTRKAITSKAEKGQKESTFGTQHAVEYGLYRVNGYVTPSRANKAGFTEDDLELLWQAICYMTSLDHANARGEMNVRGLYIFKHATKLGTPLCRPIFESLHIEKKEGVESPRQFDDYSITIEPMPEGVELIQRL